MLRRHHRDHEGDHRPRPRSVALTWFSTKAVLPVPNGMLADLLELAISGESVSGSRGACSRVEAEADAIVPVPGFSGRRAPRPPGPCGRARGRALPPRSPVLLPPCSSRGGPDVATFTCVTVASLRRRGSPRVHRRCDGCPSLRAAGDRSTRGWQAGACCFADGPACRRGPPSGGPGPAGAFAVGLGAALAGQVGSGDRIGCGHGGSPRRLRVLRVFGSC